MRILMGTDPAAASLVEHEGAKLCLGSGFEDDKHFENEMFNGDDDLDLEDAYYALQAKQFNGSSSLGSDEPVLNFGFGDTDVRSPPHIDLDHALSFNEGPSESSKEHTFTEKPPLPQTPPNMPNSRQETPTTQQASSGAGSTSSTESNELLGKRGHEHCGDLCCPPEKKTKPGQPTTPEPTPAFAVETTRAIAPIQIPSMEQKFPCCPVQMAVVKGSDGATYLQALFGLNDVVEFGGKTPSPERPSEPVIENEEKPAVKENPIVKVRKYSNATSSRFCHVCARSSRGVPMAVCQNVMHGVCRKVICEKCCIHHGWDFVPPTPEALAGTAKSGFVCPHCKGLCPERAQCNTYKRTNQRRRAKGAEKRKAIEVAMAKGEDVGAILKEQGS